MFTGCGARLTVYDYNSGGSRYNEYELTIDTATVELLEQTAAVDSNGEKYTVESYFNALFASYGYELKSATRTSSEYTVSYVKRVSSASELDLIGAKQIFDTTYVGTPFIRTYTASAPNPFNGVREQYDNVDPYRSTSVLERIKNGAIARDEYGEWTSTFPSIYEAFPAINALNPDGLMLTYARTGSARMESSGDKSEIGGGAKYEFTRYFDRAETTVDFKYDRPVPYGWYLAAIAIGAAVLAVMRVALNEKEKKKPRLLDK